MAKNLIPTVAKMLGVEMEEEFKINLCPNILCQITPTYRGKSLKEA